MSTTQLDYGLTIYREIHVMIGLVLELRLVWKLGLSQDQGLISGKG